MEKILIEYANETYPERLRKIKNPPSRLYALGNIEILNEIGIAVVGSRTNTQYGERMCKKFTKNLVEYNINIISGLAYGIDSIAHKTCLNNSGKTIAVLPSGLDKICGSTNKNLIQYILKNNGVIISEYENEIEASSEKFLERNRIVAGLAVGTLVVEAGYRSGTKVTARHTLENGNPLFCIPSSLENIKGKTTNELIQQGAELVTCVEDMFKVIYEKNPQTKFIKKIIKDKNTFWNVAPELKVVLKNIDDIPRDVNQIAQASKIAINEVNYKIMLLQLDGKILELPGHRFIRNNKEE